MRLLPIESFSHVFEPLVGKRVGFVGSVGNVGDKLIDMATFQLFDAFGVDWRLQDLTADPDCDELVVGGGGNMGTMYPMNWRRRGRALELGLPVTVFPQSFNSREDRPYKRVYVRERDSLQYCERAVLAPDLALGLDYENRIEPTHEVGIFMRKDRERAVARPWLTRDPVNICSTPEEYLQLAAKYKRIITDRLHFAICGLIVGRDTTLLPNSYHKNRSMYETWLRDLGCDFATSLEDARLTKRGHH
jgi:exopolysaccharide biosynthesis predicted pyruvyltransferase EpsI